MEVIIADGNSTDRTREVINAYKRDNSELPINVIDNDNRTIPAGLNTAISAAIGEYIVRLDAHSMPDRHYVQRCYEALGQKKGENVGGIWEIIPGARSGVARSIAIAASHPIGVGDARYRHTERAGYVDTVPFGAFRRDLIDRVGPFDETLLTNEDYEFNARIRNSGGRIWLDPSIRSKYFSRATLSSLVKQYWRYGYWKAKMLKRYPGTVRWRQALPPVFVLSLIVLGLAAIFFQPARWIFGLELILYILVLMAVGLKMALNKRDFALLFGVPAAITVMHLAWGSAFIWSAFQELVNFRNDA
jgi:glycosyltransferase involved in cell wall biosynthesis